MKHETAAGVERPVGTDRDCTVCGAEVATWPDVMVCHCHELPWKKRASLTPEAHPIQDGEVEAVIRRVVGNACYDDIRWRSNRKVVEQCVTAALASQQPRARVGREEIARVLADRYIERCSKRITGPSPYTSLDRMPGSYRADFYADADAILSLSGEKR